MLVLRLAFLACSVLSCIFILAWLAVKGPTRPLKIAVAVSLILNGSMLALLAGFGSAPWATM